MITLVTEIRSDCVIYSVSRADEVLWTRTEFFAQRATHRAGGYAFVVAAREQERQAALSMGPDERVEERVIREGERWVEQRDEPARRQR